MPPIDEDEVGDGESTATTESAPHDQDIDGEFPDAVKRWLYVMGTRAPGVFRLDESGLILPAQPGELGQVETRAREILEGTAELTDDPHVASALRELTQADGQRQQLGQRAGFGRDLPSSSAT